MIFADPSHNQDPRKSPYKRIADERRAELSPTFTPFAMSEIGPIACESKPPGKALMCSLLLLDLKHLPPDIMQFSDVRPSGLRHAMACFIFEVARGLLQGHLFQNSGPDRLWNDYAIAVVTSRRGKNLGARKCWEPSLQIHEVLPDPRTHHDRFRIDFSLRRICAGNRIESVN